MGSSPSGTGTKPVVGLAARALILVTTSVTAGLLLRRLARRTPAPAPPPSLLMTSAPVTPGKVLHHVALFTVQPRHHEPSERRRIADELRLRLQALADLPELAALRVHTADLDGAADVLLSAEYREEVHLERIRDQPRHRAMLEWYVEHFDETQRREINFWSPAMQEVAPIPGQDA